MIIIQDTCYHTPSKYSYTLLKTHVYTLGQTHHKPTRTHINPQFQHKIPTYYSYNIKKDAMEEMLLRLASKPFDQIFGPMSMFFQYFAKCFELFWIVSYQMLNLV